MSPEIIDYIYNVLKKIEHCQDPWGACPICGAAHEGHNDGCDFERMLSILDESRRKTQK